MARGKLPPEKERQIAEEMTRALQAGEKILAAGGSALDAITATLKLMEDSGIFNAGRGAVRTNEDRCELDASIVNGATGAAGAVAGVTTVKNPIEAARRVMEKTPHVLLIGTGAERFAKQQGLAVVDTSYFINLIRSDRRGDVGTKPNTQQNNLPRKFGTVGAVALDQQGHLAAGTTTGGMGNKLPGRVGDAPLVGIGTYANSEVAISCTGHGEYYIRNVVAYDIAARMRYQKATLKSATDHLIFKVLLPQGGEGGLIAIDTKGNIAHPFNTEAMPFGYVRAGEQPVVKLFKD